MNKGFTLIELLVVVLIIGILASIALPQYSKAVERSRMAEAVQVLGDLGTAQSVYYMEHGIFAQDLDTLNAQGDIFVPNPTAQGRWRLNMERTANGGTQTMARDGGMYTGSSLRLTVGFSGNITKDCIPNGHPDFCTMAETAGYREVAAPPPDGASSPEA